MSLISSIVNVGKGLLSTAKQYAAPILSKVGAVFGGPVGGVVGGVVGSAISSRGATSGNGGAIQTQALRAPTVMPGAGLQMGMGFPSLALTGTAGTALRVGGGMVVAGAKRVYSAAAGYCRRHPQWCSTIGGIAAVEAMIGRGELPVPKRRRGKGISATELKNFRRVAKFTSQYCAPVRRAMTTKAVRRGGRSCQ